MDAVGTNRTIVRLADAEYYEPHLIANLLPHMGTAQLAALTISIKADGLVDDIVLFDGKILDGRARYVACIIEKTSC